MSKKSRASADDRKADEGADGVPPGAPGELRRVARSGTPDWAAVIAALEGLVDDRSQLAELDDETRERLLKAGGALARPDALARSQYRKSRRRRRRDERRAADEAILDRTGIRNQRLSLVYPTPEPVPLPGAVGVGEDVHAGATNNAAPGDDAAPRADETVGRLRAPRSCYICKADYHQVHSFYDALCPGCAAFNEAKREQSADLSGKVALLTGGRVKIGYQAGIKLLRAGAELIVTTRFPRDAATRYAAEPDFDSWRHRLQIHGLDLRHTPSVEALSRQLLQSCGRLDLLINNACQTVRRPPGFYAHLMEGELLPYDELANSTRQLLVAHEELRDKQHQLAQGGAASMGDATARRAGSSGAQSGAATPTVSPRTASHDSTPGVAGAGAPGLTLSAALSQVLLVAGDDERGEQLFPAGSLDADLQQVDLRTRNSWRLALDEVPTIELLEVHLVNAVAPFVLAARLKPLMLATPNRDKHIVNVSAMEGQFYRSFKTDKHPHTNMAKASLNMLTRTSAPDYQRDGIHMNSVDTGWITDEDPAHISEQKRAEHGFHPPLDHVDAAARILDPIFVGVNTGEHLWGQFLKDYKPAPW